jgi:hypothetical protein
LHVHPTVVDDEWHAAVFEHLHRRAIRRFKHFARQHFAGIPICDDPTIDAHESWQVGGKAVQVVRGEKDGETRSVQVGE